MSTAVESDAEAADGLQGGAPKRQAARIAWWLLHPVVAIALTWPAAAHMGSAVPAGTESVSTVPLFNLWTLGWNVDRIGHFWSGYWNAPIFEPDPGSFARSDPQPLTGVAAWSVSWLPGGTTTAYVFVLLLALTLNGVMAARVAKRLGASAAGAAVAGVAVQASPFVTNELGVLQLTMLFGGLLAIDGVIGLAIDGPHRRFGLLTGGGLAIAALTNGYLALALATTLGPIVVVLLVSTRRSPDLTGFVLAALLPIVIAAPFVLGQQAATDDFTWSATTVEANSAELVDLVQLDEQIEGGRVLPWAGNTSGTAERLWPGALLVGLGLLGLVEARRRAAIRQAAMVLGVVAAFGLIGSLGLRLDIAGFQPYSLLRDFVPGWDRLRSPFRLVVLVTIALGPLVGLGFDRLRSSLQQVRRPRLGAVALAGIVIIGAWEVWPRERPIVEVPEVAELDWVVFLDGTDDRDPIAHVPGADPRGRVADFEGTVVDMLATLEHGHPMISGYTGLFPEDRRTVRAALQPPVDADTVDLLCARGVGWLVIDNDLDVAEPRLDVAFAGSDRDVYRVACGS
ncbi:MAG: hypothetical protein AAGA42_15865 [Actinomycetota bacterium]